jgi:hypothetical protein
MLLSIASILSFLWLSSAQDNRDPDPDNHFIYPPLPGPQYSNDPTVFESNLNFTVGTPQSQPFKWVSNLESLHLTMVQEGNPDVIQRHNLTGSSSPPRPPYKEAAQGKGENNQG